MHSRAGVQSHVQCQKAWKIVLGLILTLYINSDLIGGRLVWPGTQPLHLLLPSAPSSALTPLSVPLSHMDFANKHRVICVLSLLVKRTVLAKQNPPAKS